jgi:hypothetical protein
MSFLLGLWTFRPPASASRSTETVNGCIMRPLRPVVNMGGWATWSVICSTVLTTRASPGQESATRSRVGHRSERVQSPAGFCDLPNAPSPPGPVAAGRASCAGRSSHSAGGGWTHRARSIRYWDAQAARVSGLCVVGAHGCTMPDVRHDHGVRSCGSSAVVAGVSRPTVRRFAGDRGCCGCFLVN